MKFAYEDLSDGQFEELTVLICQQLLGIGVQGFSSGPDGGRDGRFHGVAQLLPSSTKPWHGKVIIQAKHTSGYNRTFGDADFFSETSTTSVMHHEFPRIKRLRQDGELDHYLLFSNRRLSAGVESKLRSAISMECGLPEESVFIVGVQNIETYLKQFPHLAAELPLTPWNLPLIIRPEDLAEAVEAIADVWDADTTFAPPEERISFEEKNAANGVHAAYAKSWRSRYLKDSTQIQAFLADPRNDHARQRYEDAAAEIDLKMLAHSTEEDNLPLIVEGILDQLFSRDPVLSKHKRLTRSIVFFMYWSCDIGKTARDA
jgi:hypothetical protein